MIKIDLVGADDSAETVEVEAAKIIEATCIEYKGKYYHYSGIVRGNASESIYKFTEISPPVHIPEQIKL